jgi:alanine racemase
MDQMMLDISAVENASVGDIVTVMGREQNLSVSAEDLAAWSQTINYEITCNPSRRVPRVYLQDGAPVVIENDARICADHASAETI